MTLPPVAADLFRAVAPVLGTALGGPLGLTVASVAVKALDHWVAPKGPGPATPEDVVAAVEKNAGNPALALDLARAELAVKDYELRMQKVRADFSLTKLHFEDRKDARAAARDGGLSRPLFFFGMGFVGLTIFLLFAIGGAAVLTLTGHLELNPAYSANAPVAFTLIGNITTSLTAVMMLILAFYYGSSAGSKEKTQQVTGALGELGTALHQQAQSRPAAPPPPAAPVIVNTGNAPPPPAAEEAPPRPGPHGGRRWRLTREGVVPEGETGPMRTVGQPATVRRIWRDFGPLVAESCARNGVPLELAVATIATESRGIPAAVLVEGDGRRSVGLMQTLVGTASEVMGREVTAAELNEPALSIEAGVRYIAKQRRLTGYDPPLVAAAYNAGGLYPPREGDDNPWRLRSTGDHIGRFCQFYGDAAYVAAEDGWGHADKAA